MADSFRGFDIYIYTTVTIMMINNKNWKFSSVSSVSPLKHFYITGFTDGEGCFHLGINSHCKYKFGYSLGAVFKIHIAKKDLAILEEIQSYFGVGKIYKLGKGSIQYQVSSIKELGVIIDHFDKYPLITDKEADYILFKRGLQILQNKEHLTLEGFRDFVAIKASINKGLSPELKAAFPDVIPVERPLVQDKKILDPFWLAGFIEGEGCFLVNISDSPTHKLGSKVELRFQITQHNRDALLMESLVKYLDCGKVFRSREAVDFVVTKFSDITEKIIPFIEKYPIQGVKRENFEIFKIVAELIKNKEHLTLEGLKEIKELKSKMNTQKKIE